MREFVQIGNYIFARKQIARLRLVDNIIRVDTHCDRFDIKIPEHLIPQAYFSGIALELCDRE